jgi:hypothetical protein
MITNNDKELNKLFKAYKNYKQAKAEYESIKERVCKDLTIGKYMSKLGVLNKTEGYSKIIDKVKFTNEHPEIDLTKYEKITPYSTIKIKLNA